MTACGANRPGGLYDHHGRGRHPVQPHVRVGQRSRNRHADAGAGDWLTADDRPAPMSAPVAHLVLVLEELDA